MHTNQQGLTMKIIGVKFPDKHNLKIEDISTATNINKSKVARAAMQLGLEALTKEGGDSDWDISELIAINDMKALN